MGLMEHLEELRRRILQAALALVVGFVVCWSFSRTIYEFLAQPIYNLLPEGEKLVFLGVTDPFMVYVKVALLAGTFLVSPFILFQFWRFVAPGLYRTERRTALPFILFGSLLFVGGGAFAYYIAFPFAVEFLLGIGAQFDAQITVNRYLSFLMTVMLGLGVMFELPVVIVLLARLGLVTPRFLLRNFRYAVLIIFVVAALITPTPDVFNLLIFATPTIVLYLVGVLFAYWVKPRKSRDEGLEPTDDSGSR